MKIKQKIINYLLRHLLNSITIEDVVTVNTAKEVMIGGKVQSTADLKAYRAEAKLIIESRVWSLLENTLKSQAQKVIFDKAKDFDDCMSGKLMLYNLDVQKTILQKLSK